MKILIRADASLRIGSGHVMRCLTLARQLQLRGASVTFACRELAGNLNQQIVQAGFALLSLPALPGGEPASMSAEALVDQREDWLAVLAAVGAAADWDWVIVDHYGLDAGWEQLALGSCRQLLALDDLANRPHVAQILLDSGFYPDPAQRYAGLLTPATRLLAGPKYALLRPEFAARRLQGMCCQAEVSRLLISFGGADRFGATAAVLSALAGRDMTGLQLDCVVNGGFARLEEIERLAAEHAWLTLHYGTSDMAGLMAAADIFIGAGGGTNWERCCLGLPAIVLALAANQQPGAASLAEAGVQLYLGRFEDFQPALLLDALNLLQHNHYLRQSLAQQASHLLDGRGAERVAALLAPQALTLRRAQEADSDNLLAWRNADINRRYSGDGQLLAVQTHELWFARTLADPDRALLIAERDGQAVGVLRYDRLNDRALVSIYLVPGLHGTGFGAALLAAGRQWLRREWPDVRHLDAEIHPDNIASQTIFSNEGFQLAKLGYVMDLG